MDWCEKDLLMSKFKASISGPGRFIAVDDMCGVITTRDPLPPGAIFEGTVIRIEEPIESLMVGGALEIIIRKRKENTLSGKAKEDKVPEGDS